MLLAVNHAMKFPKNKSYFYPESIITFGLPIASHSLQIGTYMSSTSHDSSTFYDTAQRCILSILSFFPQPIKTFGLSVFSSLEPKMSSTEHGSSTVYDIIFAGGCFKFYSISCSCADNLNRVRRGCCLRHCRPSC